MKKETDRQRQRERESKTKIDAEDELDKLLTERRTLVDKIGAEKSLLSTLQLRYTVRMLQGVPASFLPHPVQERKIWTIQQVTYMMKKKTKKKIRALNGVISRKQDKEYYIILLYFYSIYIAAYYNIWDSGVEKKKDAQKWLRKNKNEIKKTGLKIIIKTFNSFLGAWKV